MRGLRTLLAVLLGLCIASGAQAQFIGPSTGTASSANTGTSGHTLCFLDANCTFSGADTFTQQITSSLATGTAPFSIASTTNVPNLNASSLNGATFAAPGSIGSGTPGTGAFLAITGTTGTFSSNVIARNGTGQAVFIGNVNGAAGISGTGSAANLFVSSNGVNTGVYITSNFGSNPIAQFINNNVSSIANQMQFYPGTVGAGPTMKSVGTDTDVNLNLLAQGKGFVTAPNLSVSATRVLSGAFSNLNDTILSNTTSVTGSLSTNAPYYANDFEVSGYNIALAGAGGVGSTLKSGALIGGSSMTGGYIGTLNTVTLNTLSGNTAAGISGSYVGSESLMGSTVNDGGTSGAGNYKGQFFGFNPICQLGAAATFIQSCIGQETDLNLANGMSVQYLDGVTVVLQGNSTTGGLQETVGFLVSKGTTTPSIIDTAYAMGGGQGYDAISSTGWVMRYLPNTTGETSPSIGGGIDLSGYTISGASQAFKSTNFSVSGTGVVVGTRFGGTGTAPTQAAGTGAGTGPTLTLSNAHDAAFQLSVLTGTTPTASGVIDTVTFNTAYANKPTCVFAPENANASALNATSAVFETPSTTTWVLTAGSTALAATTTYLWDVTCVQ